MRVMMAFGTLSATGTVPVEAGGGCKSCNRACVQALKGRNSLVVSRSSRNWVMAPDAANPFSAYTPYRLEYSACADDPNIDLSLNSISSDSSPIHPLSLSLLSNNISGDSQADFHGEEEERRPLQRGGDVVAKPYGSAIRLEVVCPPDTFITVNGEATKARGARRYLDLPHSNDGSQLEYSVEAFVTRKGRLMTFNPDSGKLISFSSPNMKINEKKYMLPGSELDLLQPLVFRDDDRPRPSSEDSKLHSLGGFDLSIIYDPSSSSDMEDTQLALNPLPFAAAVATAETPTVPTNFIFDKIPNTEAVRNNPPSLDILKEGNAFFSSPIVPVHIEYNASGVSQFNLGDPLVAGSQVPISFEGKAKEEPASHTAVSLSFKIFVNGQLGEDKKPKSSSSLGNAYNATLELDHPVKVGLPTFDEKWKSNIALNRDDNNLSDTLWEAITREVTNNLSRTSGTQYLIVQITLGFPGADGKTVSKVVDNYLVLLKDPQPK